MSLLAASAVFVGAGCGALLRWGLGLQLNALYPRLPLGTLAANLLGGLLVGFAVAWFAKHPSIAPELRLLLVTGFLGGLTTFSTFSAEVITLLSRGDTAGGLLAAGAHLLGSLLLTALGMLWAHSLLRHY